MKAIAINTRLDAEFIFIAVSLVVPHADGPPSKINIEVQLARRDNYTLAEIEQMGLNKANETLRLVQAFDLAAKARG